MAEVNLAILGMGPAGESLVPFIDAHPDTKLLAVVDTNTDALDRYASRDFLRLRSVEELADCGEIDAVYVATPTEFHAEHVIALIESGKHVIVEKPMAPTLADADQMIAAAAVAGVALMVGHSHSYEAPIREMRRTVESGNVGALRAVSGWNFTDWFYRPRHPDELDPAKGGGVALRQGSHHVDTVRYLTGGSVVSVRATTGDWDPDRPGQGSYHAFLDFVGGEVATLAYSGYDHFSTTEFTYGIGETGERVPGNHAASRNALALSCGGGESAMKASSDSRQRQLLKAGDSQPFFGLLVVSCDRGDMRVTPTGIRIYGDTAVSEVDLRGEPAGRTTMLDELVAAVREESTPVHDGNWGRANLEVCLAMTESSLTRAAIQLTQQAALRPR